MSIYIGSNPKAWAEAESELQGQFISYCMRRFQRNTQARPDINSWNESNTNTSNDYNLVLQLSGQFCQWHLNRVYTSFDFAQRSGRPKMMEIKEVIRVKLKAPECSFH